MTYFVSGFVDIIELIAFLRHEVLRKVPRILCNKILSQDTFNSTLSLNDYLQSEKGWESNLCGESLCDTNKTSKCRRECHLLFHYIVLNYNLLHNSEDEGGLQNIFFVSRFVLCV